MPLFVLLLFIAVPLAEIAVFVEVGGLIGLWPTLGTVILTALIGTSMLRAQGMSALTRAQTQMAEGRMPVEEVLHGFCLVIAGALLLTPGFLTDAVGFVLFVPQVRLWLGHKALAAFKKRGTVHVHGEAEFFTNRPQGRPANDDKRRGRRPTVIDGEAEAVPPTDAPDGPPNSDSPPNPNSPWHTDQRD